MLRELSARPTLSYEWLRDKGGAVATNINMQYNETNQQYFCIVILISQQWSVPRRLDSWHDVS